MPRSLPSGEWLSVKRENCYLHPPMAMPWNTPVWGWCVAKTALDDGIEIIRRCDNPDVVVYLSAERVDFIAAHLWEVSIILATIFGSSQYRIVSELVVSGEIGFYLRVLGGSLSRSGHIITAFRFTFICACFHYMLGFVSKNEVIKRTDKFQAFRECLHNVAFIGNEVRTDFYGDRKRNDWFKHKLSQNWV